MKGRNTRLIWWTARMALSGRLVLEERAPPLTEVGRTSFLAASELMLEGPSRYSESLNLTMSTTSIGTVCNVRSSPILGENGPELLQLRMGIAGRAYREHIVRALNQVFFIFPASVNLTVLVFASQSIILRIPVSAWSIEHVIAFCLISVFHMHSTYIRWAPGSEPTG